MVIRPEGILRSKFTISQVTKEANYSKNTAVSFLHFMSPQTLCPYWFSDNRRTLAPTDCDITAAFSQHWEAANYCGRLSLNCFTTFYLQECCRYDGADGCGIMLIRCYSGVWSLRLDSSSKILCLKNIKQNHSVATFVLFFPGCSWGDRMLSGMHLASRVRQSPTHTRKLKVPDLSFSS